MAMCWIPPRFRYRGWVRGCRDSYKVQHGAKRHHTASQKDQARSSDSVVNEGSIFRPVYENTGLPGAVLISLPRRIFTNEELAASSPDSRSQIQRYIRLTELIPPVLDMVDSGKIAFRPAVELSYLSKEQQQSLYDTMECEDCTPSLAQAIENERVQPGREADRGSHPLHYAGGKNRTSESSSKCRKSVSASTFAPGTPAQKIEDTIIKALELYRRRERQRDMER